MEQPVDGDIIRAETEDTEKIIGRILMIGHTVVQAAAAQAV